MEITNLKIEDLKPYKYNNKVHTEEQITNIANSIKEFGFRQPIVVDENYEIIIGHGRYEACKKLWLKEIPCEIAKGLTVEQVRKLRILDNKLNESDWDIGNLKIELDELWNLDFWDLNFKAEELFPELDFPDFDPEDYQVSENTTWFKVVVLANSEEEVALIKKDLDWLGWKYK